MKLQIVPNFSHLIKKTNMGFSEELCLRRKEPPPPSTSRPGQLQRLVWKWETGCAIFLHSPGMYEGAAGMTLRIDLWLRLAVITEPWVLLGQIIFACSIQSGRQAKSFQWPQKHRFIQLKLFGLNVTDQESRKRVNLVNWLGQFNHLSCIWCKLYRADGVDGLQEMERM